MVWQFFLISSSMFDGLWDTTTRLSPRFLSLVAKSVVTHVFVTTAFLRILGTSSCASSATNMCLTLSVSGLAAAHHVPIASHGGDGATTHLLMATPTAIWCETGGKPKGPGSFTDRARIEDGYVYAPEASGFGMELRAEVLETYGVKS